MSFFYKWVYGKGFLKREEEGKHPGKIYEQVHDCVHGSIKISKLGFDRIEYSIVKVSRG